MTDTEHNENIPPIVEQDEHTVTAEDLKARLDVQSADMHGKECTCPGTAGASVEDMLRVQSEDGGWGPGPWTEAEAEKILKWWASPLESGREDEALSYGPEDVDAIVESILAKGNTPAEDRTGISDRKAAVLDGLSMIRGNLDALAADAAVFALAAKVAERVPNLITTVVRDAARDALNDKREALHRAVDMLTAVVKSMD